MKVEDSYELRFSGLKVGTYEFDWKVEGDFLVDHGVEDFNSADINVTLSLEKKERLMNLDFSLKGTLDSTCDRCGEPVTIELDQTNNLVVRFSHETDLTDDEVVFVDESEHQLDLSQFIYEFVMVGLPTRMLHADGECDPEVESFLNATDTEQEEENNEIDPRWEALKKLKHKS